MSPQYGERRPTSGWDRLTSLGYPCKFQLVSRLGSVTAGHLVVGISQTLQRWTEGATYIRQGDHHVGHWPKFLVFVFLVFFITVFLFFFYLILCGRQIWLLVSFWAHINRGPIANNRPNKRLHRVDKYPAGCTSGWMFVYTMQPVGQLVVQPIGQPVVSCKGESELA